MYKLIYYLFYTISLLPWFIIYFLSDILYVLIYYIIGYRKEIVLNNLAIAFPEKTEAERKKLAKEFYHHFIDSIVEILKVMTISKEELNKRFECNYDVVNNILASGQNVQLHGGHFFNWEYLNLAYCINIKEVFCGVYLPLSNKYFNKLMYEMRGKFGTGLISAYNFNREFFAFSKGRYVLALAGDQNAGNLGNAYWLPFFGKMVPFVSGPERMAVAKNAAIVFSSFYRVKRGHYKSHFTLYTTEPKTKPTGEITKAFRDFLEADVKAHPTNYLWSHRRWKHVFDETKHAGMVI